MGIYSIGVSGLQAAQMGISTTQHNIANAGTAGYSKQQITQAANTPLYSGAGFFGQGVNVTTVQRMYSNYLTTQVLQEQAQLSNLDTYNVEIQQVNNLLADPNAGLAPAVQGFFNGVNGVASMPGSQAARQTMIGSANTMIARLQSLGQRLTDINTGLNTQITSSVTAINTFASQIATLNSNIALAQASGNGTAANDLLDQRDQVISQLNQEVKVTVMPQSDGTYNVFVGNGQALVVGAQPYVVKAVANVQNPTQMEVAYVSSTGAVQHIPQTAIQGGKLGGMLAFRSQTLEPAQNGLGLVAVGLGTTFNAQHQLGQDANGALGGNFFNVPAPLTQSATTNVGTAGVVATISNVAALTTSNYQLTFNGGTSYTLLRLSDNTVTNMPAGLPQTVDGVTFNLGAGVPAAGDTFQISPTASGATGLTLAVTDPNKVAAATPVRSSAALTNVGGATVSAATVNAVPVVPNPAHPATDLNLQQPVTITFNNPPTTFSVAGVGTGAPVAVPFTTGSPITYNGWTINITGTPSAGDKFTVASNVGATTDSSNALVLAGLQTKNTLTGNTTSYEGSYAQLVSQVGNKAREMLVTSQAQTVLVTNTQQQQQAVSGVNLDEEAANLMRYQRAYQAAGNAIKVANTLFDTLLSLR